jgi:hypothetical protein
MNFVKILIVLSEYKKKFFFLILTINFFFKKINLTQVAILQWFWSFSAAKFKKTIIFFLSKVLIRIFGYFFVFEKEYEC